MATVEDGLAQVLEAAKVLFEPVEGGGFASVDVAAGFQLTDAGGVVLLEDVGLGGLPIVRGVGDVAGGAAGGALERRRLPDRVSDVLDDLAPGVFAVSATVRISVHTQRSATSQEVAGVTITTPNELGAPIGPPPLFAADRAGDMPAAAPAWVFVSLTVSADGKTASRTFDPIQVVQAVVRVPVAVVALTREGIPGDTSDPQLCYVMLHPATAKDDTPSSLAGQVNDLLRRVDSLKDTIGLVLDIAGLSEVTGLFVSVITNATIQVRERQWNLNDVDLDHNNWYSSTNDIEAEDVLSGIYLIGPPGTTAQFFSERDYDDGSGNFFLTTGPACVGIIRNLKEVAEGQAPLPLAAHGTASLGHKPSGPQNFNNRLSSLRFTDIG